MKTTMLRMVLAVAFAAALAGCTGEESVIDTGEAPYEIQVRLVDPGTGDEIPATDGVSAWSLGLPDGPALEITYWADRAISPVPLVVRGIGATISGAIAPDPYEEDPVADSELSISLVQIDTVHRSLRVGIVPPSITGRAVVSAALGGAEDSVSIDFGAPDVTLAVDAGAVAVADGATEVAITVTGNALEVVTLETSSGNFVAPYLDTSATLTLLPATPGGTDGAAVVSLVSDRSGPAVVSVTGDPANWVRMDFEPVAVSLGTPEPVDVQPGKVVYDVCVGVNTMKGAVSLSAASYDATVFEPASDVPLSAAGASAPASCPAGIRGYALFRWGAAGGNDVLTARWTDPQEMLQEETSNAVVGAAFPGFDATLNAYTVGSGDPHRTVLEATLTYRDVAGLTDLPAAGVAVTFLVLSDLGTNEVAADPATGADGTATAVHEVYEGDVLQVFLQPEGGTTIYLGETS